MPNTVTEKIKRMLDDAVEKVKGHADRAAAAAAKIEEAQKASPESKGSSDIQVGDELTDLRDRLKAIEDTAAKPVPIEKSDYYLEGVDSDVVKKFSWFKAFRGLTNERYCRDQKNAWEGAKLEYELMQEMNERMKARHQESIDESGGMFVPAQIVRDFIKLLRNQMVLESLGVRTMSGLVGSPVPVPKHTGGSTAHYVSENGIPDESELNFGQMNLEPHRVASFLTISNRLIGMAGVDIESMFKQDLIEGMARRSEQAFLFGSGGLEPRGLVTIPGVQVENLAPGPVGRVYNFDDAEIQRLIIEEKDVSGEVKFLSRPSTWSLMKRLKSDHFAGQTVNQEYLMGMPPMSNVKLSELLGGGFAKTTAVAKNGVAAPNSNTSVIAGVWSDMVVGWWDRLVLRASREASINGRSAFLQNETWMIIESDNDSNVRYAESFHVYNQVRTVK